MTKWLVAFFALCVLIAQPRLANASITASLALVGPTPINGCPANVQFTGSISGTPGTAFTYSFNRFVNGVQQVAGGNMMTMPPGGSITVNDSIPIAASTNGVTFDQIWVHNIGAFQQDVYSNKVAFTVNCVTATPTPGQTLLPGPPPPSIPNSLTSTNDPAVCTAHGGLAAGLACSGGFTQGMLALIWSSGGPNPCPNCSAGYNVYRVDGGQRTFVVRQNNGMDVTVALVPKPSDGFNGKCYAVTAYSGFGESGESAPYCVNGAVDTAFVRNFIIQPKNIRHVYRHHHFEGFAPGCGLPDWGTADSTSLSVGFVHRYSSAGPFACDQDTWVDQVAVSFAELGSAGILLRNPKASVKKAILAFNRVSKGNASCLAGVHLPTGDWSNATDLIPNKDYISGIPWSGGNDWTNTVKISGLIYNIDVTSAINNFAKGIWPDYGFLLVGGNEDASGFHDNNECRSVFGDFSLSLQVIVNP
jgi:hypothetical protein